MSNENENINTATEGAETPVNDADGADGVNTPEGDESGATVKQGGKTGKETSNPGVYVHKFKKPFSYEGKKYETLNFYFENLTGHDMIRIESEMQANNEYALDPLLSRNFQGKMAARASGVGGDVLEAMPMQEFNKITNAARNFLIDTGY
jgi:hypothetical protein